MSDQSNGNSRGRPRKAGPWLQKATYQFAVDFQTHKDVHTLLHMSGTGYREVVIEALRLYIQTNKHPAGTSEQQNAVVSKALNLYISPPPPPPPSPAATAAPALLAEVKPIESEVVFPPPAPMQLPLLAAEPRNLSQEAQPVSQAIPPPLATPLPAQLVSIVQPVVTDINVDPVNADFARRLLAL
jgi:hypothetical protein